MELSGLVLLAQAEPEPEYMFRHALIQEAAQAVPSSRWLISSLRLS